MSAGQRAVVLLSGGLDSATVLAMARERGYECYALSFDYGQRHRSELQAAARVSKAIGAREHRVVSLDLTGWGGSALTLRRSGNRPGCCINTRFLMWKVSIPIFRLPTWIKMTPAESR